jgi:hypothetical protein
MKIQSQREIVIAVVLALVAFAGGCATFGRTSGVERAEKATASMQAVNSDISEASMQIDTVKASLDHLLQVGQSQAALPDDVKVAFDTFSEHADKMKDVGGKLNEDIDTMASDGNDYFLEWAKEGGTYTDPNIMKLSEDRRAKLNSTFREMQSATASVRANLNTYLNDLDQVQTYLSNDLTPQGVAGIAWIAQAVERDGARLKESFDPVEATIMQARAELTPGSGGTAAGGVPDTRQQPDAQQQPGQTSNDAEAPDAAK